MNYHDELCQAMTMLGERSNTIFLGQGVVYQSTSMSSTFEGVPKSKRLEMPVAEGMQMGMATGMSLGGFLPICVFPRWNFVLRAASELVNELDRLPIYSAGRYRPKVIIRTAVPSTKPFNPQSQHDDDFTEAFRKMVRTIVIKTLPDQHHIMPAYLEATERDGSTILVEYTDLYRNARGDKR